MKNGHSISSGELTARTATPAVRIYSSFPNPFNPATTIPFSLSGRGRVRLDVFDVSGNLVRTLVNGTLQAGYREITWRGINQKGKRVESGIYFLRLETDGKKITRKAVLPR